LLIDAQRDCPLGSVAAYDIVPNLRTRFAMSARPVPTLEAALERLLTEVGIDVAVAPPSQSWVRQVDRNPRARCYGPPNVPTGGVQFLDVFGQCERFKTDGAGKAGRERHRPLMKRHRERRAVPRDFAGADDE
jgi:hypothetical protein